MTKPIPAHFNPATYERNVEFLRAVKQKVGPGQTVSECLSDDDLDDILREAQESSDLSASKIRAAIAAQCAAAFADNPEMTDGYRRALVQQECQKAGIAEYADEVLEFARYGATALRERMGHIETDENRWPR